jgi:RNA polymerase sigma-70 factor (ECF subfamily)
MNWSKLADNQLVTLVQTGDENAFREIYTRYWQPLFLIAYKKIHHKQPAEEIIQNIFAGLWKKREILQVEDLAAYLHTALKYQVISHIRAQIVQNKYVTRQSAPPETGESNAEERILMHDLSEAIEKGVALLPGKTQEVFVHSRVAHRSVKEISGMMHISEKAVEYHITRSLKLLRFYLKEFIGIFLIFFIRL